MSVIARPLLVIMVFILVILGLNTSSQGISNLTMNDSEPVIGVAVHDHSINLDWLGASYSFDRDKLSKTISFSQITVVVQGFHNYLLRIWRIFYAVFIY